MLSEIDKYCARNLQERDERNEAERRRQHEAQHAQQISMQEEDNLTAGENTVGNAEPEKEIDPSLVGSLDDVYPDEPGTEMDEEVDPFKKVPVMDEHEKPSSLMAMERSLDAMAALTEASEEAGLSGMVNDTGSPPSDEDITSLDSGTRQCNNTSSSSGNLLPDLVGVAPTHKPDVAELGVGGVCSVDLLEDTSHIGNATTDKPSQPLDLTDGLTGRTQQVNS